MLNMLKGILSCNKSATTNVVDPAQNDTTTRHKNLAEEIQQFSNSEPPNQYAANTAFNDLNNKLGYAPPRWTDRDMYNPLSKDMAGELAKEWANRKRPTKE